MKMYAILLLTVIVSYCGLLKAEPAHSTGSLTASSKLEIAGIGSVKIGMTVKEASKAIGQMLIGSRDDPDNDCYFVRPKNESLGILFMVTGDRIARIDIIDNSAISTVEGARIDSTEAEVKKMYAGNIEVTPHVYTDNAYYFTIRSKDAKYSNHRLIFETGNGRISRFRAGKLPEVEYIEGCS